MKKYEIRAKLCVVPALLISLTLVWGQNTIAESLCSKEEKVVFSCATNSKIISLCATSKLSALEGKITYRFGKLGDTAELEYSNDSSPPKSTFLFDYESWAKGESSTVSFKRGAYQYLVYHAHGVFGVDGGPNRAGVRVLRDNKEVTDVACNEAAAIDNFYNELHSIGLPSSVSP